MYFCLSCGTVHQITGNPDEVVFKTGFHYVRSIKYAVGLCGRPAKKMA
ncbi:DUF3973 domain-containing protein [Paenibacillus thalictri]